MDYLLFFPIFKLILINLENIFNYIQYIILISIIISNFIIIILFQINYYLLIMFFINLNLIFSNYSSTKYFLNFEYYYLYSNCLNLFIIFQYH